MNPEYRNDGECPCYYLIELLLCLLPGSRDTWLGICRNANPNPNNDFTDIENCGGTCKSEDGFLDPIL